MENLEPQETPELGGVSQVVVPDILNLNIRIVNVQFVGDPKEQAEWVLIDAGLQGSEDRILETAAERFGANNPPKAIILTHGHFDHIGALEELLQVWDVPVYAHPLEMPYLTGKKDYPPPDPTVGGGLVAGLSFLFPNDGINISGRVHALPEDGTVPQMPGWRWLHTPGHTPGHVSLFRDEDRVLLAGDAFITVKQESLLSVLTQEQVLHGPPAYFTTDWQSAWESVRKLEALKPAVAYTGHGMPASGEFLSDGLHTLAREFDRISIPDSGRYVQ